MEEMTLSFQSSAQSARKACPSSDDTVSPTLASHSVPKMGRGQSAGPATVPQGVAGRVGSSSGRARVQEKMADGRKAWQEGGTKRMRSVFLGSGADGVQRRGGGPVLAGEAGRQSFLLPSPPGIKDAVGKSGNERCSDE